MNPIIARRESREKLIERVKLAQIAKHRSQSQKDCEHDFETFKETIRNDTNFSGTAYFTVKGCLKCHYKIRVNYTLI